MYPCGRSFTRPGTSRAAGSCASGRDRPVVLSGRARAPPSEVADTRNSSSDGRAAPTRWSGYRAVRILVDRHQAQDRSRAALPAVHASRGGCGRPGRGGDTARSAAVCCDTAGGRTSSFRVRMTGRRSPRTSRGRRHGNTGCQAIARADAEVTGADPLPHGGEDLPPGPGRGHARSASIVADAPMSCGQGELRRADASAVDRTRSGRSIACQRTTA